METLDDPRVKAGLTKQAETRMLVTSALRSMVEPLQAGRTYRGRATVAALARFSGVSVTSIYKHFGGVSAVAAAVVQEDLRHGQRTPERILRLAEDSLQDRTC